MTGNVDLAADIRREVQRLLAEQDDIGPDNRLWPGYLDRADDLLAAWERRPGVPTSDIEVLCETARLARQEARQRQDAIAAARRAAMAETAPTPPDPSVVTVTVADAGSGRLVRLRLPAEYVLPV